MKGVTDADVDRAFDDGRILRTHFLRPTWHFVAPADIRWMLALSGPRVNATNAHYYRKVGLDDRTLARCLTAVERALEGGRSLTRQELRSVLQKAGLQSAGMRLAYVMMRAELDGVVCSGPRRGKQFTYALLDERVPRSSSLDRDEALAALARRYFSSHGPATLRDYVWWSGLTARDARAGIEMAKPALVQDNLNDLTYWHAPSKSPVRMHLTVGPPAAELRRIPDRVQGSRRDRVGCAEAQDVRCLRSFSHRRRPSPGNMAPGNRAEACVGDGPPVPGTQSRRTARSRCGGRSLWKVPEPAGHGVLRMIDATAACS